MKRTQYPSAISSKPQQPDEITAAEAAALLGVTKGAIASAVALGYLPSRLIRRPDAVAGNPRVRVIKRADVEAYGRKRGHR